MVTVLYGFQGFLEYGTATNRKGKVNNNRMAERRRSGRSRRLLIKRFFFSDCWKVKEERKKGNNWLEQTRNP